MESKIQKLISGNGYRGRLAPSPTGFLHLGHALTFWRAQERARAAGGMLVLRIEDLDTARCREEFRAACLEDLHWFGLRWDEGPFRQSERAGFYRAALAKLRAGGFVYPCTCSRRDVEQAIGAPHHENDEPLYPGTCRGQTTAQGPVNWRFRVPDGMASEFLDGNFGLQCAVAGRDFGDFLVWRRDDLAAYQLAVVVDDAEMRITEVVRGADLLTSTFRQLLLYRALELPAPVFFHTPLVTDANGRRLAKRDAALSLRALRAAGRTPEELRSTAQI